MRIDPVNNFKAQPRFFTAALVGALLWFTLSQAWRPSTRLLVAWDGATGLYLVMAAMMMATRTSIESAAAPPGRTRGSW